MRRMGGHRKQSVKSRARGAAAAAFACAVCISSSLAADVDPNQIERRIEETGPHQKREPHTPPGQSALRSSGMNEDEPQLAPFLLSAVRITGAQLMPAETLIPAYEDFIAQEANSETVTAIARRMTAKLRSAGYSLSYVRIPTQNITAGVLTVEIVPGRVESLSIPGMEAPETIRPYFAPLLSAPVATQALLERSILLVHDLPGLTVTDIVVEEEEASSSGAYELKLTIEETPVDASFYSDNRGSRAVGPVQAGAAAGYNNALLTGDRLSATYFTVPDATEELQYFQGEYSLPIGKSGLRLKLSAAASFVDAGAEHTELGTESEAKSVNLLLSYPLKRTRDESLWISGGAEALEAREDNKFGEVFEDRLIVLRAGLDYSLQDELEGRNYITLEVRAGHGEAGAVAGDTPLLSRPDAEEKFVKAFGEIYRHQIIPGTDLVFGARLSGQISSAPLLSSEEFSLGGARYGRAYQYGELTGDSGLTGSLELAYTPNLGVDLLSSSALYGFYDLGAVWNRNAVSPRQSLASAGAGIRLELDESVFLGFEAAKPLTRDTEYNGDRGMRYFFSLGADL